MSNGAFRMIQYCNLRNRRTSTEVERKLRSAPPSSVSFLVFAHSLFLENVHLETSRFAPRDAKVWKEWPEMVSWLPIRNVCSNHTVSNVAVLLSYRTWTTLIRSHCEINNICIFALSIRTPSYRSHTLVWNCISHGANLSHRSKASKDTVQGVTYLH